MTALATTLKGEWPTLGFAPARLTSIPVRGERDPELEYAALSICAEAGLILDPWEEWYFLDSLRMASCVEPTRCQLGPGPHQHWAALECGLCLPRQNGKNCVLEARELTALFIDAERWPHVAANLTVHSAHLAKTAHESFERLLNDIENSPRLRAKIKGKPSASEGGEVIKLLDKRRIRFCTRTSAQARGLSGDLVIFDEAMIFSETIHGSVWPIITARPNPQAYYTGSSVDQQEPLMCEHGIVFSRIRKRGLDNDPDLLYAEWSLDYESPDEVPPEVAADPDSWAKTNPNLDTRLSRRIIAVEQRSMSARNFARERLGVGDWFDPDATGVISEADWKAAALEPEAPEAEMLDPVCYSIDVAPNRNHTAIAVAGKNAGGKNQVEIIAQFSKTAKLIPTLKELTRSRPRTEIIVDTVGAAASLIPQMEQEKLNVQPVTGGELARGCGMFVDAVVGDPEQGIPPNLNHLDHPALNAAVIGAAKRPLGDRWAWDRKDSSVDISPLVAATLALYGFSRKRQGVPGVYGGAEFLDEEELGGLSDEAGLPPLDPEDL